MIPLKVLSIDVGILNLGYVYAEIYFPSIENTSKYKNLKNNENYTCIKDHLQVISCGRIDITKMKHTVTHSCDCTLRHERCIPDYLDHFIQEHSFYFEECDVLLIERQPPMGITNVQDLLFTRFRNKVKLISPNSVHKYFGLGHDYLLRKEASEAIAKDYLNHFTNFIFNERKHDISDALLMILYYYKNELDLLITQTDYSKNICFEEFKFLQK